MYKRLIQLYTASRHRVSPLFLFCALMVGCGSPRSALSVKRTGEQILARANQLRQKNNLSPLQLADSLNRSAAAMAQQLTTAKKDDSSPQKAQERIVRTGAFARFAISTHVVVKSTEDPVAALFRDPLKAGLFVHRSITHFGLGVVNKGLQTILVVDMARLVAKQDLPLMANTLLADINERRTRIGVTSLKPNAALQKTAEQLVTDYLNQKGSKEGLIQRAQAELGRTNFSLGKITVAFSVVSDPVQMIIPERTSDPSAKYVAIGITQGNHPAHDPGALIVAIFLASPQGTTSINLHRDRNLPAPKAMPGGHATSKKQSIVEQAWVATLAGNHPKAAKLFSTAFQKTGNPEYLYEAARALARDQQMDQAAVVMRQYVEKATPENRTKGQEALDKLAAGMSIFSEDKKEQISVEAKRFFIMGQKLFEEGQWQGAIDAFGQAYAYAPHPDLIYNMGLAYLKAGEVGEALDYFQEYQRLIPKAENLEQARQLFSMGVELYEVGQYDAAAARFTMAYSAMPLPEILFNLALCHQAMGNRNEALRVLGELLDKTDDPDDRKEIERFISKIEKQSK